MGLTLNTGPSEEPLTLTQAKNHLRVEIDDDDELISNDIRSARQWCESFTHRKLITQTWDLSLDRFPLAGIELPFGKTTQVVQITYIDSAGTTQTLTGPSTSPPGTGWQEDLSSDNGGILTAPWGGSWPTARDLTPGAVTIRFVTGYGLRAAVPEELVSAMLYRLSDLYDVRGTSDLPQPTFAPKLVDTAAALAEPFVLRRF